MRCERAQSSWKSISFRIRSEVLVLVVVDTGVSENKVRDEEFCFRMCGTAKIEEYPSVLQVSGEERSFVKMLSLGYEFVGPIVSDNA